MRIMSVDDDPIILEILQGVLNTIGQTDVTFVESALSALDILNTDSIPFDCFLLDIQMPVMDGIQLCDAIRSNPIYNRTPIIMVTTASEKTYIDRAFSVGASDYVTKPFDVMELSARIKTYEDLVEARKERSLDVIPKRNNIASAPFDKPYTLSEKLHIDNVDGVIDYMALENYVGQLSRSSLFGSNVIAFHIVDIERLFDRISAYDFGCMITDVAEAITFCFKYAQILVSYAGNGSFVCVYNSRNELSAEYLNNELHQIINSMDLSYSDGRPIIMATSVGKQFHLTLRFGKNIKTALRHACKSAEQHEIVALANNQSHFA